MTKQLLPPSEFLMARFMFLLQEKDSTQMPIFITAHGDTDWKRLFDTLSEDHRRWLAEKAGLDERQKKQYNLHS